ncbi:MAG: RNase J family beta-CASP ribonuclease [archaeon]
MTIEVFAIGGYEEVGQNMTAVKVGDKIVILDMGIALDKLLLWGEHTNFLDQPELLQMGVLPDDSILDKYRDKVIAIVASHAHLDHIGAIGKMAAKYNCPIVGTPFTIELLRANLKDEKSKLNNFMVLNPGEVLEVGDFAIEFVHITHSVPQTTFTALHTPEGIVFYANDYKFDNYQVLSAKPDYKRIKKLGQEGIKAVIMESVRADKAEKTPSEMVAKELLKDTLTETLNEDKGIAITCFASHIERLNSILEVSKNMNRQVIFAGRSLEKYCKVAEKVGVRSFKNVEILGKQNEIKEAFKTASKNKKDYLLVTTGGQGEPNAVLSRIANGEYAYKPAPGDEIIFSCSTIPNPSNIANRSTLEKKLKFYGARIFRDVHTSGHGGKEDHRDLLTMLNPEHVIPCHGDLSKLSAFAELTSEMNQELEVDKYLLGETVHILRNGQRLVIQ